MSGLHQGSVDRHAPAQSAQEDGRRRPPATSGIVRSDLIMDELVQRLAHGEHPINARRYPSAAELHQAIERGYVLVKFTATQGGTELGLRLERERCNLSQANFAQ